MHQVSKQMMESEREINAGGKFPMTQIILLFLGNQFVNNLCVFLGRGGRVANVAVVNLPRVISTKLYTLHWRTSTIVYVQL